MRLWRQRVIVRKRARELLKGAASLAIKERVPLVLALNVITRQLNDMGKDVSTSYQAAMLAIETRDAWLEDGRLKFKQPHIRGPYGPRKR